MKAKFKVSIRILLAAVACLSALFVAIGCTRGGDDTPVFTSEGEFRDNLKRAESISKDVFEKADKGEPLTDADRTKLKDSLKVFSGLYAYKPTLYTMPFAMGKAHQLLGDDDQAMKYFNAAAVILEGTTDKFARATLAEVNYLAVESLIKQKQFEAALEAAKRAVAFNDQSANYHAALASAYLQLEQVNQAETEIKKALAIDPKNRKAIAIAKLYAWGMGSR